MLFVRIAKRRKLLLIAASMCIRRFLKDPKHATPPEGDHSANHITAALIRHWYATKDEREAAEKQGKKVDSEADEKKALKRTEFCTALVQASVLPTSCFLPCTSY